jgi:hypothetical protein
MNSLFFYFVHNDNIESKRFPQFTNEMCFIAKKLLTGAESGDKKDLTRPCNALVR